MSGFFADEYLELELLLRPVTLEYFPTLSIIVTSEAIINLQFNACSKAHVVEGAAMGGKEKGMPRQPL